MTSSIPEILQTPIQRKLEPLKQFARDSRQFLNRCTKPSVRELQSMVVGIGCAFLVIGFTGYIVRLIHIPIINIIVHSGP